MVGMQDGRKSNNTIFANADNSVAIGNRVSLLSPNILAWSDFKPDIYDNDLLPAYFTGSVAGSTITRAYKGFSINKTGATVQ